MKDDTIKKSDVIDAVKIILDRFSYKEYSIGFKWAMSVIETIPSADRPQGEWIGEADGYYNGELVYDTWYCSNCDHVVDDEEPPTWNFCPNCGCAMTKE